MASMVLGTYVSYLLSSSQYSCQAGRCPCVSSSFKVVDTVCPSSFICKQWFQLFPLGWGGSVQAVAHGKSLEDDCCWP